MTDIDQHHESGPAHDLATTTTADTQFDTANPAAPTSSQQVSWWAVHEFVASILAGIGSWPMAGTPAWCGLLDDDPTKWAALFDAGRQWALRVETCQVAECEASEAISAAEDWTAIATRNYNHARFYAERPWLKRATS